MFLRLSQYFCFSFMFDFYIFYFLLWLLGQKYIFNGPSSILTIIQDAAYTVMKVKLKRLTSDLMNNRSINSLKFQIL